jgi:hypothetical protein
LIKGGKRPYAIIYSWSYQLNYKHEDW